MRMVDKKKIEEDISNASRNKQEKSQEESRPNSSNWLLSHWKIAGIIVMFGSFLVISIIIRMKKRKCLVFKNPN